MQKNNETGLSWGMVHADYHGQGIGKLLTQFRLDLLKNMYPDKSLRIETSQHTAEFYKKMVLALRILFRMVLLKELINIV
ncbi:GNAT family N-acetyltransferase [Chryseobacterium sp. WG14]|uniref:GNAT family N-acetyltransferase n=1 Tax=Chryseobacterium sp. WG14 TaxID=2926909 RepID=UPI00211E092A|nr:GNAT family N-acetyltransferase [Chryseobacterium sp. WG14]MCQ9641500.1 GNAT family N-acetyltransferase [Chryseobacterium sp. WG14]